MGTGMFIPDKIKRIYFLAISGTAMASFAAMLKQMGYEVYGSDQDIYPPMSTFLQEEAIPTFTGWDVNHLSPPPDLVVIGNAISRGNVELEEILDRHLPYISLPDALREFCIRGKRSIVITGTHGKTTTTSLIAWIFDCAGREPSFLIGGIPNNFGRGSQVSKGEDIIVEGDEYDSAYFDKVAKFLRYLPDIGIINNIEFDHADIYNSLEEIKTAFRRFVNLIPRKGLLVACQDYETVNEIAARAFCPVQGFGLSPACYWQAREIMPHPKGIRFQVFKEGKAFGSVDLPLYGLHNVRNALAAIAVAHHVGIPFSIMQEAFASFKGIRRRLELVATVGDVLIFDDFGHHPTAIKETLAALRNRFPNAPIWALFEPRTATTRRNIFQQELAEAFGLADTILIAPVDRPEKAPPGMVFSTEKMATDLRSAGKEALALSSIDAMVEQIAKNIQTEAVVITFSNGPFGGIHQKIISALSRVLDK